jgi:hypothetical protein
MKPRDEIIAENPIEQFLANRQITLKRGRTNRCARTEHKAQHSCVDVDVSKGTWRCHDCEIGGTVIDWLIHAEGLSVGEAMKRLGGDDEEPVATYDYTDENGALLFQVCRFEPKDFRQRKPDGKGGWIRNVKGVRNVPFRLPELLAAIADNRPVVVAEGEKDVLALAEARYAATCNAGGALKWSTDFAKYFKGADVTIVADRDDKGRRHAQQVAASLHGIAGGVRVVEVPDVNGKACKDCHDYFAAGAIANDFYDLVKGAPHWSPAASTTESDTSARSYDANDAGRAEHFIDAHVDQVRYVPAWAKWLIWAGHHWQQDRDGAIERLCAWSCVRNHHRERTRFE